TECGLDNVILHGVEHSRCKVCGEEYYGFGSQAKLHELIAKLLIEKKGLLNGKEIRFLRTYIGYSALMFSELTGHAKETISRFENEKSPITKTFDLLMRSLVANRLPDRNYDWHDLLLNKKGMILKKIELNAKDGDWSLAA